MFLAGECGVSFFDVDGATIRIERGSKLEFPLSVGGKTKRERHETTLPFFWYFFFTGKRKLTCSCN